MAISEKWRYRIFMFLFLAGLFTVVQAEVQKENQPAKPKIDFSDLDDEDMDKEDEDDEDITKTNERKISDPLEVINRPIYWVNDKLYTYIMRPVTRAYRKVVHRNIRSGFGNFFSNLQSPLRMVNQVLQGKFKQSGRELRNFATNSTLGIFGFLKPSSKIYKQQPLPEDFGQTFGHWGVGPGWYIMWPFTGPTTARDFVGNIGDGFLTPTYYAFPHNGEYRFLLNGFKQVNSLSFRMDEIDSVKQDSLDPYLFIRDAYFQYREEQVKK